MLPLSEESIGCNSSNDILAWLGLILCVSMSFCVIEPAKPDQKLEHALKKGTCLYLLDWPDLA